jgi:hypothetical protein
MAAPILVQSLDKQAFFTLFNGLIGDFITKSIPYDLRTNETLVDKVREIIELGATLPRISHMEKDVWATKSEDENKLAEIALGVGLIFYERMKTVPAAKAFFDEATVPDFYRLLIVLYDGPDASLEPLVLDFCKALSLDSSPAMLRDARTALEATQAALVDAESKIVDLSAQLQSLRDLRASTTVDGFAIVSDTFEAAFASFKQSALAGLKKKVQTNVEARMANDRDRDSDRDCEGDRRDRDRD